MNWLSTSSTRAKSLGPPDRTLRLDQKFISADERLFVRERIGDAEFGSEPNNNCPNLDHRDLMV